MALNGGKKQKTTLTMIILLAAPSAAGQSDTPSPSLRLPVIVYTTVAVADLASTVHALQRGGHEQNPFFASAWNDRHQAVMLAEGAAVEIGTVYVLHHVIA